ncbi:TetR/AcrR family transcriptional regulator [Mycobacterium sp. UM_Kg1]|uniref:TetR/AcrR family transcriptional regulator n=1 Tax=Mycobacterium sp. UM_Kg1 TaxID=1545691 RepID=UPI00061B0F48|nr:TetR/AcrR family transcriptional regulator [Mycobacterium sp. UM_Kg1]
MPSTQAPLRLDRRKAKSRAALVNAARGFLAQNTTNVSILEITAAADVGFGTFYNHFTTKDELFTEAVAVVLDEWGELIDLAVAGLQDPAEIFARSFRIVGRAQRLMPEAVRVLLNAGMSILVTERGIRPRALADLRRGIELGRFAMPDAETAVMLAGGVLLALMQLLESAPTTDAAATSDLYAEKLLVMLGIEQSEAHAISTSALPEMKSLSGDTA